MNTNVGLTSGEFAPPTTTAQPAITLVSIFCTRLEDTVRSEVGAPNITGTASACFLVKLNPGTASACFLGILGTTFSCILRIVKEEEVSFLE